MAHNAICLERAVVFQPRCNVCGTWFKNKECAKQHVEKGFVRGQCPEHRSSFKGVVEEREVHEWSCAICEVELEGVHNIRAHMLVHMDQVCQQKGYTWPIVSELCAKIREHEITAEGEDLINGAEFGMDTIPFIPPRRVRHERVEEVPPVREVQPKRAERNVPSGQSLLSSFGFVCRRSQQ